MTYEVKLVPAAEVARWRALGWTVVPWAWSSSSGAWVEMWRIVK